MQMQTRIANQYFYVVETVPNGNCLFQACYEWLKLNAANLHDIPINEFPNNEHELRRILIDYVASLEEDISFKENLWNQYLSVLDELESYPELANLTATNAFIYLAKKHKNAKNLDQGILLKSYTAHLRNKGIWGGDYELYAFQLKYKVQVIINSNQNDVLSPLWGEKKPDLKHTIYLHLNNNHYSLLIPKSMKVETAIIEQPTVDLEFTSDNDKEVTAKQEPKPSLTLESSVDLEFTSDIDKAVTTKQEPKSSVTLESSVDLEFTSEICKEVTTEQEYKPSVEFIEVTDLRNIPASVIESISSPFNRVVNEATVVANKIRGRKQDLIKINLNTLLNKLLKNYKHPDFTLSPGTLLIDYCKFKEYLSFLLPETIYEKVSSQHAMYKSLFETFYDMQKHIGYESNIVNVHNAKLARGYYKIASLLHDFCKKINVNYVFVVSLAHTLLMQAKNFALKASKLGTVEIPTALEENHKLLHNASEEETKNEFIDLCLLHLNHLAALRADRRDTTKHVELLLCLANIYKKIGFREVSKIYVKQAFDIFLNLVPSISIKKTEPQNDQNSKPNLYVEPQRLADIKETLQSIEDLEEAVRPIEPRNVELEAQHSSTKPEFWRLLDRVYGHKNEQQLFNDITNKSAVDDFAQLHDCKKHSDIIKFLITNIFNSLQDINEAVLNTIFPSSQYKDVYQVRTDINNNIHLFFADLLYQRKYALNKFAELKEILFNKLTSYEFLTLDNSKHLYNYFSKSPVRDITNKQITYTKKLEFLRDFIIYSRIAQLIPEHLQALLCEMLFDTRHNHRSYINHMITIVSELIAISTNPYTLEIDTSMSSEPMIDINMPAGVVSQIKKLLMSSFNAQEIKQYAIRISATFAIYYDCDMTEPFWNSLTLSFNAPNQIVTAKSCKIDVSGAIVTDNRFIDGDEGRNALEPGGPGMKGGDGENGLYGNSGGNIYVWGANFFGKIDVVANGSAGTRGGNGGRGGNALDGEAGKSGEVYYISTLADGLAKYNNSGYFNFDLRVYNSKSYPNIDINQTQDASWYKKFNSVVCMVRGGDGKEGGVGGNGGNAGAAGLGGKAGSLEVIDLGLQDITYLDSNRLISRSFTNGQTAPAGIPGSPGKSGLNGINAKDYYKWYPKQPLITWGNGPPTFVERRGRLKNIYMQNDDITSFAAYYLGGTVETPETIIPDNDKFFSDEYVNEQSKERMSTPKPGIVCINHETARVARALTARPIFVKALQYRNSKLALHSQASADYLAKLAKHLNVTCDLDTAGARSVLVNSLFIKWSDILRASRVRINESITAEQRVTTRVRVTKQKQHKSHAKVTPIEKHRLADRWKSSNCQAFINYNQIKEEALTDLVQALHQHAVAKNRELECLFSIAQELCQDDILNLFFEQLPLETYEEFIQKYIDRMINKIAMHSKKYVRELVLLQETFANNASCKENKIAAAKLEILIQLEAFRHLLVVEAYEGLLSDAYKTRYIDALSALQEITWDDDANDKLLKLQKHIITESQSLALPIPKNVDYFSHFKQACAVTNSNVPVEVITIEALIRDLHTDPSRDLIFKIYSLILDTLNTKNHNGAYVMLTGLDTEYYPEIVNDYAALLDMLASLATTIDAYMDIRITQHKKIKIELNNKYWAFKNKHQHCMSIFDLIILDAVSNVHEVLSERKWAEDKTHNEQQLLVALRSLTRGYVAKDLKNSKINVPEMHLTHLFLIFKYLSVKPKELPEDIYEFTYMCLRQHNLYVRTSVKLHPNLQVNLGVLKLHLKASNINNKQRTQIIHDLLESVIDCNLIRSKNNVDSRIYDNYYKLLQSLDILVEYYMLPMYLSRLDVKAKNKGLNPIYKLAKKTVRVTKDTLQVIADKATELVSGENLNIVDNEIKAINNQIEMLSNHLKLYYIPSKQLQQWCNDIDSFIKNSNALYADKKCVEAFKNLILTLTNLKEDMQNMVVGSAKYESSMLKLERLSCFNSLADYIRYKSDQQIAQYVTAKVDATVSKSFQRLLGSYGNYVEIVPDAEDESILKINGQSIASVDIVLVIYNASTEVIEDIYKASTEVIEDIYKFGVYDKHDIRELIADKLDRLNDDQIVIYFGRPAHCPQALAEFLALPKSDFYKRTLIIKDNAVKSASYVNDLPVLIKVQGGIFHEIESSSHDTINNLATRLVACQSRLKDTLSTRYAMLPDIATHIIFRSSVVTEKPDNVMLPTGFHLSTSGKLLTDLINSLHKISQNNQHAVNAVLNIEKYVIRIMETNDLIKRDAKLMGLSNFVKLVVRKYEAEKADISHVVKLLNCFANTDDVNLTLDSKQGDDLKDLQSYLYIGRFVDSYMNLTVDASPRKIYDIQLKLGRFDVRLLQLFYNKFIKELYNQVQTSKDAPKQPELEVYTKLLDNIVDGLLKIDSTNENLIKLLNSNFTLWESTLNALHFDKFISEWPEINAYKDGQLIYLLNRTRLNLGDPRYAEFLNFLHVLKSRLESKEVSLSAALLLEASFENIKFVEVAKIVEIHTDPEQWDKIVDEYAVIKDGKILTEAELIADLRLQYEPAEREKLDIIQAQLEEIMGRIKKYKDKPQDIPQETAINLYFSQLFIYNNSAEKTAWLSKKATDGFDNIVEFVTHLAAMWIIQDPDHRIPRATQILSLLLSLHSVNQGLLQEIKTGQGKTLIVGMLAAAKALLGFRVDVVSSNSDLATKGQDECAKFYKSLRLNSTYNTDDDAKLDIYENHIIYGDAGSFEKHICENRLEQNEIFNARYSSSHNPPCLIVDEVDSLSLDKASEMLRITHNHASFNHLDLFFIHLNFAVTRVLCDSGLNTADFYKHRKYYYDAVKNKMLVDGEFPEELCIPKSLLFYCKTKLDIFIENSFEAALMIDKDNYIITGSKFVVMDKATGMESDSTQYSEGLQQGIQISQQLKITPLGLESNFISNKTFFQSYKEHIFGLTGTLGKPSSRDFLKSTYQVKMLNMPTHAENRFRYTSGVVCEHENWTTKVAQTAISTSGTQPVIIICENIDAVEKLRDVIRAQTNEPDDLKNQQEGRGNKQITTKRKQEKLNSNEKPKRRILTYKQKADNEIEKIIKSEGGATPGTIVIATNKGGRGTDIEINFDLAPKGLHVILSYLPENIRIEKQAFGRAARNGKPGSGNFVVAVDKVMAGEPDDQQIERLRLAQEEVEEKRIREIKEVILPQNVLKEELAEEFRTLYRLIEIKLTSLRFTKELSKAYLTILNHKFAFWLESVNPRIKEVNQTSLEKTAQIKRDFKSIFAEPMYNIAQRLTKDTVPLDMLSTPEDAIILGRSYLELGRINQSSAAFIKAIELGDVTGYAHRALAVVLTKKNGGISNENKKLIRRQVKLALETHVAYIKTMRTSMAYLQVIRDIIIKNTNGTRNIPPENAQIAKLTKRIAFLDLHTKELLKIIGENVTPDFENQIFGSKFDAAKKKDMLQAVYNRGFVAENYIRKYWIRAENKALLRKKVLSLQGRIDIEALIQLFDKESLHKNLAKLPAFRAAIYDRDELWSTLTKQLTSGKSAVKSCYWISTEVNKLLATDPQDTVRPFCDALQKNNVYLNQRCILADSHLYKLIEENAELQKELIANKIIVKTETFEIDNNLFKKFDDMPWGKYQNVDINNGDDTIIKLPAALKQTFTERMLRDEAHNRIFKLDLPFTGLEDQITIVINTLNDEGILKSNTLARMKYDIDSNKVAATLKKELNLQTKEEEEVAVKLFESLQGRIRSANNVLAATFVSFDELFPEASKKPKLRYFADMYLQQFLSISNQKPLWDWNVAGLVALALIQLAAGIVLIIFCPGIGAFIGEALIELAIQDMFCAYDAAVAGKIDWSAWAQQKAIASLFAIGSKVICLGMPINPSVAQRLGNTAINIIRRQVTAYATNKLTNVMIHEFGNIVVDNVTNAVCSEMLKQTSNEIADTLAQIDYVWSKQDKTIYKSRAEWLKEYIAKSVDLAVRERENDHNLKQSIASATDAATTILSAWADTSTDSTIKGIGAVLKHAGAAVKVATAIKQGADFRETRDEVKQEIDSVLETEISVSIPYQERQAASQHRHDRNVTVAYDAKVIQERVQQSLRTPVENLLSTTIKNAIGVSVTNAYQAQQAQVNVLRTKQVEEHTKGIKLSFTVDAPRKLPKEALEAKEEAPKLGIKDLENMLAQGAEVAAPVRFAQNSQDVKLGILRYCQNLAEDPVCYFELQMVANFANVQFCIFQQDRTIAEYIYPEVSNERVVANLYFTKKGKVNADKMGYDLVDTTKRCHTGCPDHYQVMPRPDHVSESRALLFSVLRQLSARDPVDAEIDAYRREIIKANLNKQRGVKRFNVHKS